VDEIRNDGDLVVKDIDLIDKKNVERFRLELDSNP